MILKKGVFLVVGEGLHRQVRSIATETQLLDIFKLCIKDTHVMKIYLSLLSALPSDFIHQLHSCVEVVPGCLCLYGVTSHSGDPGEKPVRRARAAEVRAGGDVYLVCLFTANTIFRCFRRHRSSSLRRAPTTSEEKNAISNKI